MSDGVRQQKVWHDPRFSLNALMKYTSASAVGRRRLIHEQKYPATFRVIWYEVASKAIKQFIAGGMTDESIIASEIGRLNSAVPTNEQEEQRYDGNVEAMQSFLDSYDAIEFHGLMPALADPRAPHVIFSGVDISVSPDIYTSGDVRGREAAGALRNYLRTNVHPVSYMVV
jgi:hypothetical protein